MHSASGTSLNSSTGSTGGFQGDRVVFFHWPWCLLSLFFFLFFFGVGAGCCLSEIGGGGGTAPFSAFGSDP